MLDCYAFDLDDFPKIVELMDGAISPNGQYVAFVSNHWHVKVIKLPPLEWR